MVVKQQPTGPGIEDAMYAFVDAYDRAYAASAARQGLTVPQICVLIRLDQPRPMGWLATELFCDASNITRLVTRLEARDLITRDPDPSDRRGRLIRLTAAGAKAVRGFRRSFTFEQEATGRLSDAEAVRFAHLLDKASGRTPESR